MQWHRQFAHDLSKFHDEILAAIPALRPTAAGPVMTVEGQDLDVWLTLPDDTSRAVLTQLQALAAAHDPTPRVDPRSKAALRAEFDTASTPAAKLAVIRKLLDD